jgi:hypothetical protein
MVDTALPILASGFLPPSTLAAEPAWAENLLQLMAVCIEST